MLQISAGIQDQKNHPDTWTFLRVLVFRYSRAPNDCPAIHLIVANIPHMHITIRNLGIASGPS